MKKLLLLAVVCLGFVNFTLAQEKKERKTIEQTDKGKWFLQTDLGSYFSYNRSKSTSFNFNENNFAIGLKGGYFLKKNLAITAGLGYSDIGYYYSNLYYDVKTFSYSLGAKYYFKNNIFLEADIGGRNFDVDIIRGQLIGRPDPNRFDTGIKAGYAWFIGKYLSIEPAIGMRYEHDKYISDFDLDINLGVSVHF